MMRSSKARFMRMITIPIRALGKARDMYVKSMRNYADRVNHTPTKKQRADQYRSGLPKSYSSNSAASSSYESEDFRELVRAASARRLGDLGLYVQTMKSSSRPRAMQARSSSVAMGRIEEDEPLGHEDHDDDGAGFKKESSFPRSKSHAVTSTTKKTFLLN